MKGVIITERTVTEMLRAIAVGRQAGHAESNETIDQLFDGIAEDASCIAADAV